MAAAALTGVSVAELARAVGRPPPAIALGPVGPSDAVMQAEEAWAPVAQQLAARKIAGVVGYWGPVPADRLHGEGPPVERFYQAQFALAPVVLEADGLRGWVIVDIRAGEERPPPPGYAVVRDFGNGRWLLRRAMQ